MIAKDPTERGDALTDRWKLESHPLHELAPKLDTAWLGSGFVAAMLHHAEQDIVAPCGARLARSDGSLACCPRFLNLPTQRHPEDVRPSSPEARLLSHRPGGG